MPDKYKEAQIAGSSSENEIARRYYELLNRILSSSLVAIKNDKKYTDDDAERFEASIQPTLTAARESLKSGEYWALPHQDLWDTAWLGVFNDPNIGAKTKSPDVREFGGDFYDDQGRILERSFAINKMKTYQQESSGEMTEYQRSQLDIDIRNAERLETQATQAQSNWERQFQYETQQATQQDTLEQERQKLWSQY